MNQKPPASTPIPMSPTPAPSIRTPDQRLRVFVSSTLDELGPERRAAREAIAALRLTPVFFEAGARPYPPSELYRAYLAQSDIFIAIYWQRYGWVAPAMDISGLEEEYWLSEGKTRLIYVKRPAPEREPRLQQLLDRIRNENATTYQKFSTPTELHHLLANDLAQLLTDRFARPSEPLASPSAVRWRAATGATILVIGLAVGGWFLQSREAHPLTNKDTIVLADFDNRTGDAIFDDTLKQALSAQLGQSPFLNVLSERKVEDTLQFMGRPANERVTRDVARQLCVRAGSKAIVLGSISNLEGQYVLGITAVACGSGDTLASEQEMAATKPEVLKALSKAAASLRGKIGESLASVQKFDVPFDVTTTSLEALKAFSMGVKAARAKGDAEAIPFHKRALELDPNFALAYADLGVAYANLGQSDLAAENIKKAYALRDRVSETEKYSITALYYTYVAGELEQAAQTYVLWAESYPRVSTPHGNLAVIYSQLGQYEKSVTETQKCLQLEPDDVASYVNLGDSYLQLNRQEDADKAIRLAQERKLDAEQLHWVIYQSAFLKGDAAGMERQVAWAAGKPGNDDLLLSFQSDTEAYYGRLGKARDFSRRAVDSAVRNDSKENAALWQVNAALREAEFGNAEVAKRDVAAALALAPCRDVKLLTALVSARVGDTSRAQILAEELEKSYPSDTIRKFYWLPAIKAAMELDASNPTRAVVFLEAVAPYDLGWPPQLPVPTMYPVYIRGQAELTARNGAAAATEFQKLLGHPGVALNYPLGALARLGLARAYAMQGDTIKAKAAYQNFLALWKDADPDIPILKQAKAEYATQR
jgi:eukaryotic-like serine/threonine-protein kinase